MEVDPNATAFAELAALLEKDQFRAAVKKSDELLKSIRGDIDALQCKAYALYRRSKFAELASAVGGMADENLKFYAAYAHYKLDNLNEALKAVAGMRNVTQAVMELKGQILYKQGNYHQARHTFEQCLSQHPDGGGDIKTNLLAALVASGASDQMDALCQKYHITPEDGFEITFNQACNRISLGDYDTASELLELTFRSGQESLLEEGLPQEDVQNELLPVTVQLSYVRSVKGTADDTIKEMTEAVLTPGIGTSIKCVVENNLLAARSRQFSDHPPKRLLYESAKKLEKIISTVPPLVSPAQSVLMECNRSLLLIALNHMEDARPIVERLLDEHGQHETVKMTHAVMLTQRNKLTEAATILQDILSHHTELCLTPLLFRAQLLCSQGSVKEALGMLDDIQDDAVRFQGSMVATKVTLMEQGMDYTGCSALLDAALNWWRQQDETQYHASRTAIAWCLDRYATIKLKQGDLVSAIDYCKQALEVEQDDLRRQQLISKLARILACVEDNQSDVDAVASLLPEGPSLTAEDVDGLEGHIKGTRRGEISSKARQQLTENSQARSQFIPRQTDVTFRSRKEGESHVIPKDLIQTIPVHCQILNVGCPSGNGVDSNEANTVADMTLLKALKEQVKWMSHWIHFGTRVKRVARRLRSHQAKEEDEDAENES